MPLTAHGFVSDPLAPLAWDLFLARLGLAKMLQDVSPDEEETRAIADIGVVLAQSGDRAQVDATSLISSRGGPLYASPQASFAALATIRSAFDSPFTPLRREAASEMVDISRYFQADGGIELDKSVLHAAHETCQVLLTLVNRERPSI